MSGIERTNCFGETRRPPGMKTGCFGEGTVRRYFEDLMKPEIKNPKEVTERKNMGHVTKVIFADRTVEYHIFDSQVGFSRISHLEGANAEIVYDRRQQALARTALDRPQRFNAARHMTKTVHSFLTRSGQKRVK